MSDRSLERAIVTAMAEDVDRPPDWLLGAILDRTERVRPLTPLLALVAERPMVMPSQVVVGVRRSRLLMVAAAVLLAAAALAAGALLLRQVPPSPDQWTTWGGSAARTVDGVTGPAGLPRVRWAFRAGGPMETTPAIAADVVVVTSGDGVVHALELSTGAERWAVALGARAGAPTIEGGLVLVVDDAGDVHALRLVDGVEAWRSAVEAAPAVDLAAADDAVLAAGTNGDVVALAVATGGARWRTSVPGRPGSFAGFAASNGLVVAASGDETLVALRLEDGTVAWTRATDGEPRGTPTIGDGIVWVGAGLDVKSGGLSAYDLLTGAPRWHVDEPLYAPVVSEGTAVSASAIGVVSARDAATGVERWRFSPGGFFRNGAIAGGIAMALSDTQRQVYGLDVATGALRWQLPLDAVPGCCVAVAMGVLVVGTTSGAVTAYESSGPPTSTVAAPNTSAPTPSLVVASPAVTPPTPGVTAGISPLRIADRLDGEALGLSNPLGVAVGASGDLYVTDSGQQVTRLTGDGALAGRWGRRGDGRGEFDFGPSPGSVARGSIAVGSDGLVYVSDSENHRVQVFTADGSFVRAFGSLGSGAGQFTIPFDLAVDAAGNSYVLDDGAERITKFSPIGETIWTADSSTDPRLLGHPHTAAFDSAGRLVVAIDDTRSIVRLDPATGRVLDTLPNGACESAVDAWDRIYTIDCFSHEVRVLDAAGGVIAMDPELRLRTLRFGADGRAVAVTSDGSVLLLDVTPP